MTDSSRVPFEKAKQYIDREKPNNLSHLILLIEDCGWTVEDWKRSLEEESSIKRSKIVPPPVKVRGPKTTSCVRQKDNQLLPVSKIDNINDYMRNLVIKKKYV